MFQFFYNTVMFVLGPLLGATLLEIWVCDSYIPPSVEQVLKFFYEGDHERKGNSCSVCFLAFFLLFNFEPTLISQIDNIASTLTANDQLKVSCKQNLRKRLKGIETQKAKEKKLHLVNCY
jgi:hypothetical protein